jgi:hypothetical protein
MSRREHEGRCRNCGRELPGKRCWCWPGVEGRDCAHEWNVRTNPGYARRMVEQRDRGVCCVCGLDTVALKGALHAIAARHYPMTEHDYLEAATLLWLLDFDASASNARYWGFRWARAFLGPRTLWQADHVVPVVDGGADLGLANLRTLCIPCHRRETAALRRALAFRRRAVQWFGTGCDR